MKIIFIITLLLFNIIFSQAQVTFNRFYNKIVDTTNDLIIEPDGYIIPMHTLYLNLSAKQVAITKLNLYGDTLWQKIYGNVTNDYFIDVTAIKTFDGNYAFGSYYSDKNTASYFSILKTDTIGDSIWFKKYAPDTNYFYDGQVVIQTSDSGYLIAGQKVDKAITDGNAYIMKLDKDGNYLWDQEYLAPGFDNAISSIELPDKGFFILGWTRSFGAGQRDVYLIKTDSLGNKKWHKTFGTPEIDTGVGITKTSDGNYLISGQFQINNFSEALLIKIDTSGNIKFQKHYLLKGETEFWFARELSDGNIISSGSLERDQISYIANGMLAKMDSIGNLLWYRDFPVGNENAWFRNVYPTADGGFIMPGSAVDGPSGNQDAWLVKVDSLGCDSTGCALYTALPSIAPLSIGEGPGVRIFPNPCSNFFTLKFTKPNYDYDTYTVTVINMQGQIVHKQKMVNSTQAHPIFVQSLAPGFYMVQVNVGDKVYFAKLVKR